MVEGGSLSEHDTESGFHGYALSFNHPVVYMCFVMLDILGYTRFEECRSSNKMQCFKTEQSKPNKIEATLGRTIIFETLALGQSR